MKWEEGKYSEDKLLDAKGISPVPIPLDSCLRCSEYGEQRREKLLAKAGRLCWKQAEQMALPDMLLRQVFETTDNPLTDYGLFRLNVTLNFIMGYEDKDNTPNKIMSQEKRLQNGQEIIWGMRSQKKIRGKVRNWYWARKIKQVSKSKKWTQEENKNQDQGNGI